MSESLPAPATPRPPRLLDQLRHLAFDHFQRPEPGDRYADWARRFILFHGTRHPRELGPPDIARFLEHVAQTDKDPVTRLEQAREALDFLYRRLCHIDPGELPFPEPPRLLDRLRRALRVRHYSPRTEDCYAEWVARFIRFHGLRHPNTMGAPEIEQFLTDLAVAGHVSASTQNQAFNALLFLYQHVLGIELPRIAAARARRPRRLPAVLSPDEVRRLLDAVRGADGTFRLMARLMYGAGLRREECCRVRVHDLDVSRDQLVVRHGKDRVVMLPARPQASRQARHAPARAYASPWLALRACRWVVGRGLVGRLYSRTRRSTHRLRPDPRGAVKSVGRSPSMAASHSVSVSPSIFQMPRFTPAHWSLVKSIRRTPPASAYVTRSVPTTRPLNSSVDAVFVCTITYPVMVAASRTCPSCSYRSTVHRPSAVAGAGGSFRRGAAAVGMARTRRRRVERDTRCLPMTASACSPLPASGRGGGERSAPAAADLTSPPNPPLRSGEGGSGPACSPLPASGRGAGALGRERSTLPAAATRDLSPPTPLSEAERGAPDYDPCVRRNSAIARAAASSYGLQSTSPRANASKVAARTCTSPPSASTCVTRGSPRGPHAL